MKKTFQMSIEQYYKSIKMTETTLLLCVIRMYENDRLVRRAT
jgi:hypothetical protein